MFPVYRLANIQECPGDQGPSPDAPMVTHGQHSACVNGLFTKHGPWQRMLDAAMMLPLSDAARDSGGDTNNDPDLEDESQGWSLVCVRVAGPPGDGPIVCQCAGVSRPLGERKRKYCFWPGRLWDGMGGRPLFKVKLILNFRINEREMACHEKL